MEADEKVFRHSPLKIALTSAGVVIVGSSAFLSANPYLYLIAGSLLILAAKYAMSSARISNQGITITGLLSPKSMAWSEVGHVSIKSPSVELHARHGGRVLSIDGELQGYMEILDILASKRPDLFDNEEADPASNFQFSNSFQAGITIVIFAVTLFLFLVLGEQEKFIVLAVGFLIGMYVAAGWLSSPQSISLDGEILRVRYPLKEVCHSADEIQFTRLERQVTKFGYLYFVQIHLKTGKDLRFSHPDSKRMYRSIRKWHEQHTRVTSSSPF